MFANDKNIDNLQQLLAELKKYAELQKDYVKLYPPRAVPGFPQ